MRNSFKLLIFTVALLLPGRGATAASSPHSGVQKKIEAIASREALRTSVVGVFAMTADGDTLVDLDGSRRMVPASNMKLITTGVALRVLGTGFRFRTAIACDGPVENGVLRGNLYIVGGGDPSTGDPYKCTRPLSSLFCEWKKILSDAGIREIRGLVVGDPRFFDGDDVHEEWSREDIGFDYGAVVTGLNFNENIQKFHVVPSSEAGAPVTFTPEYPQTPWMEFRSSAVTSPKGGGDRTWYSASEIVPVGVFRGSFPAGRESHTPYYNPYGAYTCAYYFYNYLKDNNILSSGWADLDKAGHIREDLSAGGLSPAPDSLRTLGETFSRPLCELVSEANRNSDNFYTEAFFRMVGSKVSGSASMVSSRKAVSDAASALGRGRGLKMVDGCGLSRKNYLSPAFLVSFLRRMVSDSVFPEYLSSLPHPGEGTLLTRFAKSDDSLKERIRMKSGSMDGVRCFSGYILPSSAGSGKMIVFSVMTNNATAGSFTMFHSIEEMIACLAAEN